MRSKSISVSCIRMTDKCNSNDLWRWASSFGASVSLDLSKSTTHVVGSKDRYTGKMRTAARNPNIKIVSLEWLSTACREWRKPEEEAFLIPVEPSRRRTGGEANGKSPTSRSLDGSDSEDDLDLLEDDDDQQGGAHGHHPSIGDMDDDEWSKMHEMFDSDEDDDEDDEVGDNESETASQSGDSRKKRKREDVSDTESTGSRGSSANGILRRKRRAAGRASSLNQVVTLADIEGQEEQPAASQPEHKAEKPPDQDPPEEEDDEDWGNFNESLEEAIAQEDAERAQRAT